MSEPQAVQLEPTICCTDLWPPKSLDNVKLAAYKTLIARGDIKIKRVIYHKASGYTTVEYWSAIPHAWTLGQLRELARSLDPGEQIRMDMQSHKEEEQNDKG